MAVLAGSGAVGGAGSSAGSGIALRHTHAPSYVFVCLGLPQIEDTSGGCGQAFEVIVVADKFEGLTLLKRHRLVNAAIEEELKSIHAFSQVIRVHAYVCVCVHVYVCVNVEVAFSVSSFPPLLSAFLSAFSLPFSRLC